MQRTPSHSRTQRGARCTVLSRRRRPSGPASPRPGRASRVLVHRPNRQAARTRPDPASPPDPGRPEWRPEASAGSRVSERGEGGSLSFPLRPSSNQPCAHPRPAPLAFGFRRSQAELFPATAAPRRFRKFLAKNSLSLLTWGTKGSWWQRGGAPASLPAWERCSSPRGALSHPAWGDGCAGVSEALTLAVLSTPRWVPRLCHSRAQPPRGLQRGAEAGGSRKGCPRRRVE